MSQERKYHESVIRRKEDATVSGVARRLKLLADKLPDGERKTQILVAVTALMASVLAAWGVYGPAFTTGGSF